MDDDLKKPKLENSDIVKSEPAEKEEKPLLELQIQLTQKEIFACLRETRRAGKGRLWVQTAILLLVFVYSIVPYIYSENHESSSLFIAVVSIAVIIAMWLVPEWQYRMEAKRKTAEGANLSLTVYEDKLVFVGENPVTIKPHGCKIKITDDLLILTIGSELIGIPRRLTDEDGWKLLREKLS